MSVVSLSRESVHEFRTGSRTIGTTAEALAGSLPVLKYVTLRADEANTGAIRIGETTGAAASGYKLAAGSEVRIYVDNVARIYVVAESGSQSLSWLAI